LLDEAAVLSAMVYADLNPVGVAMAEDLDDSDYTSIEQRIRDTARKLGSDSDQPGPVAGVPGKCSLSVSIAQCLNLIDWTGRPMHPNRRSRIDPERPQILDRLGLADRSWTPQVKAIESEFYRAIGAAESLIGLEAQRCPQVPGALIGRLDAVTAHA
jgi:hypothetical protein